MSTAAAAPPKLTPTRVDVSLTTRNPELWSGVPEVADAWTEAFSGFRHGVLAVAGRSEKVMAIPRESRVLHLEGLAKAGKDAQRNVSATLQRSHGRLNDFERGLDEESRAKLRSPRSDVHHALAAQQIRERIARADKPGAAALKYLDDTDALAAILSVPAAASGLSRKEYDSLLERAELTHLPHVAEARRAVRAAREALIAAAQNAERMIAEASGLQKTASGYSAPWEIDG